MLAVDPDPKPPAEIARACGFSSQAAFDRAFRSLFGFTAKALQEAEEPRRGEMLENARLVVASNWRRITQVS